MHRIEVAYDFALPREELWAFITTPSNWTGYWPGVTRVEDPILDPWPTIGNRTTLHMKLVGVNRPLTMNVTRVVPGRMLGYLSRQPGLPDAEFELQLASSGAGTRYRICIEYQPRRGPARLFDRYVVSTVVRRHVRRTLHNLGEIHGQVPQLATSPALA